MDLAHSLLCQQDFPGKNTGVGCQFLLQGTFPTQGLNLCFLHQQVGFFFNHWATKEALLFYYCPLQSEADPLEKTLMLGNMEGRRRRDDRGRDGWMASPSQWTWVWASSRRWWRTGKPGMPQTMGPQRVGHNIATQQQRQIKIYSLLELMFSCLSVSLSHVWLFGTPWNIAHQTPLPMEFSRQEYWSVTIPFSRGSSRPRDQTQVFCIADRFFTIWATREAHNLWCMKVKVKSLSCVQLFATPWTATYQTPLSMAFSRQ